MAGTGVETIKLDSDHLRGDLMAERDAGGDRFSTAAGQLLKFHGIYQQDDRDRRRERSRAGQTPAYSCMVRCSVPGGVLQRRQWLEIDRLADHVGDGRLRLTTRQGVQYHFVHKGDLGPLIASLNRGLVTTYGACGDVVRNIMVSPAPERGRDLARLESIRTSLTERFRPRSSAYWELWLDGERAVSTEPEPQPEPLYGDGYLPRKFKIGIAWPGDNSVDLFSNDLGFVLAPGLDGSPGAVVVAGGGLGRSHTDPSTFPRLAEPLAWVPDGDVADVAEAVVTTFRDHGDRADRSHARLKYLVHERGLAWLRGEVERRFGHPLADPVPIPPWGGARDHLGWHRQNEDDRWYLGLPIPTGRLADSEAAGRRSAVRAIVDHHASEVRLTPHQDLLLCNIATVDKPAVEDILARFGVPQAKHLSLSAVSAMACPALPTCGQALGEAERVLPELTTMLDRLLNDRGLDDLAIETRMTGCPNGCARPYVAELGIVGRTKKAYDLFIGGDRAGTRLAFPLLESVPFTKLGDVLAPLLDRFRGERSEGEAFGDWAHRIGAEALRDGLPTFDRTDRTDR